MATQHRDQASPTGRRFLLTTLVGGVAVLLPVYLSFLFVGKMLQGIGALFAPIIDPISAVLPLESDTAKSIVAIVLLLVACFVLGLLVRTSAARLFRTRIRPRLQKLPGFNLLSSLTQQITRLGSEDDLQVVAVALGGLDEALSIGFLISHDPGRGYVVFVPSVPTPASGDLFIVTEDKVFPIGIPFMDAVKFFTQWGAGSREIMQALVHSEQARRA